MGTEIASSVMLKAQLSSSSTTAATAASSVCRRPAAAPRSTTRLLGCPARSGRDVRIDFAARGRPSARDVHRQPRVRCAMRSPARAAKGTQGHRRRHHAHATRPATAARGGKSASPVAGLDAPRGRRRGNGQESRPTPPDPRTHTFMSWNVRIRPSTPSPGATTTCPKLRRPGASQGHAAREGAEIGATRASS